MFLDNCNLHILSPGPGIPAGANHGDNIHIYESGTRNSGRGIAHLNIANPMSILLTSVHMLDFLGLDSHARIIEQVCMGSFLLSRKVFEISETDNLGMLSCKGRWRQHIMLLSQFMLY